MVTELSQRIAAGEFPSELSGGSVPSPEALHAMVKSRLTEVLDRIARYGTWSKTNLLSLLFSRALWSADGQTTAFSLLCWSRFATLSLSACDGPKVDPPPIDTSVGSGPS